MRKIEFRTWDKDKRVMEYEQTALNVLCYHIKGHELMQYIGLKDKNGLEIYEGDCLRWEDWEEELTESPDIYLITWKNDAAKFVLNCYRDGRQLDPQDADFRDSTEFEVIGNIYENPELLEAGDVKS